MEISKARNLVKILSVTLLLIWGMTERSFAQVIPAETKTLIVQAIEKQDLEELRTLFAAIEQHKKRGLFNEKDPTQVEHANTLIEFAKLGHTRLSEVFESGDADLIRSRQKTLELLLIELRNLRLVPEVILLSFFQKDRDGPYVLMIDWSIFFEFYRFFLFGSPGFVSKVLPSTLKVEILNLVLQHGEWATIERVIRDIRGSHYEQELLGISRLTFLALNLDEAGLRHEILRPEHLLVLREWFFEALSKAKLTKNPEIFKLLVNSFTVRINKWLGQSDWSAEQSNEVESFLIEALVRGPSDVIEYQRSWERYLSLLALDQGSPDRLESFARRLARIQLKINRTIFEYRHTNTQEAKVLLISRVKSLLESLDHYSSEYAEALSIDEAEFLISKIDQIYETQFDETLKKEFVENCTQAGLCLDQMYWLRSLRKQIRDRREFSRSYRFSDTAVNLILEKSFELIEREKDASRWKPASHAFGIITELREEIQNHVQNGSYAQLIAQKLIAFHYLFKDRPYRFSKAYFAAFLLSNEISQEHPQVQLPLDSLLCKDLSFWK